MYAIRDQRYTESLREYHLLHASALNELNISSLPGCVAFLARQIYADTLIERACSPPGVHTHAPQVHIQ